LIEEDPSQDRALALAWCSFLEEASWDGYQFFVSGGFACCPYFRGQWYGVMRGGSTVERPIVASLRATIELRKQLKNVSEVCIDFVQGQHTPSNNYDNNNYDDGCQGTIR
jgi:hypothetical protein